MDRMTNTMPCKVPAAAADNDVRLEPSFRYERDVLVLGGAGCEATARAFLARGLKRIIAYLPVNASHALPELVQIARSKVELWQVLTKYEPAPDTVTVRRIPGGGFGDDIHREIVDMLQKASFNRATFAKKGRTWVRHLLSNMKHMASCPAVGHIEGKFRGWPCVIVSPGPSLEKNIHVLAQHHERVVVIASNRSVAPLRAAGITPDFVVVADPLDLRYQLDGDLLDGVPALVLELACNPNMFALKANRTLVYTGVAEIHESAFLPLGQQGLVVAGGSVATTAFRYANHLGCNPLITIGQDLALEGERYYAKGAPDEALRVTLQGDVGTFHNRSEALQRAVRDLGEESPNRKAVTQPFLQVPAWGGEGQVTTSAHFDLYRRWYESFLPQLQGEVRIINATEGGAHIQGAEHAPLAQVMEELPDVRRDVEEVLAHALEGFPQEQLRLETRAQLSRMQRGLELALAELSRCEAILKGFGLPEDFQRLDEAEGRLSIALARAPFLTALCLVEVELAQKHASNAGCLEDSLAASGELYSVLRAAAESVLPSLEQAVNELGAAE